MPGFFSVCSWAELNKKEHRYLKNLYDEEKKVLANRIEAEGKEHLIPHKMQAVIGDSRKGEAAVSFRHYFEFFLRIVDF